VVDSRGCDRGGTPYPVVDGARAPLTAAKSTDLHVLKWSGPAMKQMDQGRAHHTHDKVWMSTY
jgi:hypothetical protein